MRNKKDLKTQIYSPEVNVEAWKRAKLTTDMGLWRIMVGTAEFKAYKDKFFKHSEMHEGRFRTNDEKII